MTASATKRTTRKTTKAPVKKTEELAVVASNLEEEKQTLPESSETVCIACALPLGLKFDDVPNGHGGTKEIVFPGLNQALRGGRGGILVGAGHAVAVTIARKDWEAIKRMHGREDAFVGVNGNLPCLIEMDSIAEFNSRKTEIITEMKTGLEAADPKDVGVTKSDLR